MAKPPDAFLSYTRFDDQTWQRSARFANGPATSFARSAASRSRSSRTSTTSTFGERWSDKLDQILDQARFFIPIMTPSYFKSEACRKELQKFLEAEERVGRKDLIIPIYYIQSAVLDDKAMRAADYLATVLAARQHSDWRHLRLYSFRNRKVRLAIDELAREIDHARRNRRSPEGATSTLERIAQTLSPGTVFRDIEAPWCPEMVVIPPGGSS